MKQATSCIILKQGLTQACQNFLALNSIVRIIVPVYYLRLNFYKHEQANTNLYKKFCEIIKNKNGIRLSNCHVSLLKEGFDALCRFYDWIRRVSTV